MKPISSDVLDQALDRFYDAESDEALDRLVDDFAEAQPLLFTFLLTMGEQDFQEPERESLLFLGMGIWYIMQHAWSAPLPVVSETILADVRAQNEPLFEATVDQDVPSLQAHVGTWRKKYDQPEVLNYIVDELEDQGAEGDIREEQMVIMGIFLKIVIDAFQTATP